MSRSTLALFVLALGALGLTACGGGGGGGGGGNGNVPGPLVAIAIQGEPAPGGVDETYGSRPATAVMDVSPNGTAAFEVRVEPDSMMSTAGIAEARALFVAEPDGTVTRVFTTGDTAPGRAELIAQFNQVWVCDDGTVVVEVGLAGGTSNQALLGGSVSGGSLTGTWGLVYENTVVAGVAGGAINGIEPGGALAVEACRLFVMLRNAADKRVLYAIDADGANGLAILTEGISVLGQTIKTIDGYGVSEDGTEAGVVVDIGTSTVVQQLWRYSAGGAFQVAVQPGTSITPGAGGGTITDVYKNNSPIYVFDDGTIIWVGFGSGATPDQILFGQVTGAPTILVRSGFFFGGDTVGTIDLLHARVQSSIVLAQLQILGNANVPFSLFAIRSDGGTEPLIYPTRPYTGGGSFAGNIFGLRTPGLRDGSRDGSLGFRDSLVGGPAATGIFWARRLTIQPNLNYDLATVALEGDATPDGDQFGPFTAGDHTSSANALLFWADTVGGSGLYRQGP